MNNKMIYRPIGKTGMSASIIGLGCEHLDKKPYETVDAVIGTALDNDVNILDVFMPGEEVRKNIGKTLRGKRDKVLIQGHIGASDINQQYDISRDEKTVRRYFEDLLKHLGTDYIDVGILFFIDNEKHFSEIFDGFSLQYALDLKKKGVIRAIGASSHHPITARRVVETGYIDLLMFSINPAFDIIPPTEDPWAVLGEKEKKQELRLGFDPDRAALYRLCEQKGVAVTAMKTLGAAKLLNPDFTPFSKPLTSAQCIHYALTRPAVVSALVGCSTVEQMRDTLNYLNTGEGERDYSRVINEYQGTMKGSCVYCSHCQPCPSEINIADVNKYLDIAELAADSRPDGKGAAGYMSMEHKASECVECGSCEEKCPFSVKVIQRMKKAAALFGV